MMKRVGIGVLCFIGIVISIIVIQRGPTWMVILAPVIAVPSSFGLWKCITGEIGTIPGGHEADDDG